MTDTIFALATAPGKAGVAIIRVSGPGALDALATFGVAEPVPRMAQLRTLRGADGRTLDQALVLYFPERSSFTGERVVELHLHGSIAVQRAVHAHLQATGLARLAEPGEFTRRALLNDRLDMTQVQGLADVIDAETEMQRRAAMDVFEGCLSTVIASWRSKLVRAMALLEATIDFADEEVPVDVWPEVRDLLTSVRDGMQDEMDGAAAAQALREGFEVAILGPPNSGKSSLINYLTKSEAALVSEIPGTTRDVIERAVDIGGMKVILLDTAGLRDTDDIVEGLGIERAVRRAREADLRIALTGDGGEIAPHGLVREDDISVRSKVDISGGTGISTVTGQGIDDLIGAIEERLSLHVQRGGYISRERDRLALEAASHAISNVLGASGQDGPVEMAAAELRSVTGSLDTILGRVGVEDVLDEVFRSFCLGK